VESGDRFLLCPFVRQARNRNERGWSDRRAALSGAFFLRKAESAAAERLGGTRAAAVCVRESLVHGFKEASPEERYVVLDRLIRFFRAVPAYILYFRKDNSFWKVIDELEEREARRGTS